MRIWGGSDYLGLGRRELQETNPTRLRYNIPFSVIDTLLSTIGTMRPRVRFLTNDADWDLRRRARKAEHVIAGEFYRNRVAEKAPQVFTDCAVLGTGWAAHGRRGNAPHVERSLPFEWRFDPYEAARAEPLTFWRIRAVDRMLLASRFRAIDLSRKNVPSDLHNFESLTHHHELCRDDIDQVTLIEAWRVALGKEQPGRYVALAGRELLESSKYLHSRPPVSVMRWQDKQGGYWGRGLVEILRPFQDSLNLIDHKIGKILHLASNVKIVTFGPSVNRESLNNEYVQVHEVPGPNDRPPVTISQNAVPTELFQQRAEIIRQAFEIVGVSEQRVAGKKPAGLTSGVAQREFNEIADQRQMPKAQRYEQLHVDIATGIVQTKNELADGGHDEPVGVDVRKGRRMAFQQLRWKDARIDDQNYRVTPDPASSLPLQTSARMATLQEWYGAGLITRQQFLHLSNVPDLDAFSSFELAPYEHVLDLIDDIVEEGKHTVPEPTDDLELTIQLMSQAANKFRREGAPQERLDALSLHIELARQLVQVAQQAQQPPAQAPQESQEQILAAQSQQALQ